MGAKDVVEQLKRVQLFSGCSNKELATIAQAVRQVHHPAGTVIAKEGDPGIGLFVLVEGTCDVTIGGKLRAKLDPGESFGEIALVDGGPRTATVVARTDVTLFVLTEWVFRGLMVEHPSIAVKALEAMAGRLRNATAIATA